MKDGVYVIFNRRSIDRTAKTQNFTLQPGELAVRIEIEVEDQVFTAPTIPTIRMTIPAEQLIRPVEIDAGNGGEGGSG